MKATRQNTILELIKSCDIETQEDLVARLTELGFKVTQATISRDIKELHLVKTQTGDNKYKYTAGGIGKPFGSDRLLRIFKETVTDIQTTGNIIVVKTLPASASTAAEVIDSLNLASILGSIAGDNTVFVAIKSGETQAVANALRRMALK